MRLSTKRLRRPQTFALFTQDSTNVPAVGGCVELQAPHSEHILAPEVVLFEPSELEIFAKPGGPLGSRLLFLNTPLTKEEQKALAELHQYLAEASKEDGEEAGTFPLYMRLHALRILQFRKFNVAKAAALINTHLTERVKRLPIRERDVLEDLSKGFMYWHGRDRKCRPCLVIRIERMGDMKADRERAVKLVLFVLEYGIRFTMVPGRVENWVVIIDLANASSVVSVFQLASLASTASSIATILESVYCCRMVWVKIVNMSSILASLVNGLIPSEKKEKIGILTDMTTQLAPFFEPNQLEKRYGGGAPDLQPQATYPFKFFPNCTGQAPQSNVTSVHKMCTRPFHEGHLWEDSTRADIQRLQDFVSGQVPLTATAAKALANLPSKPSIKPCQDLDHWVQIMALPEERQEVSVTAEKAAVSEEVFNPMKFKVSL